MNTRGYRVIQVLSVTVILAAEVVLSFILIWLVKGHGIIACGKGLFDNRNWFLDVVFLIGTPASLIAGGATLFLWCSSKRTAT